MNLEISNVIEAYEQGNYEFCEALCSELLSMNIKYTDFVNVTLIKINAKKNDTIRVINKCNELFISISCKFNDLLSGNQKDIDYLEELFAFMNICYLELFDIEKKNFEKNFYLTLFGLVEFLHKYLYSVSTMLGKLYIELGLYELAYNKYDFAVYMNPDGINANTGKLTALQLKRINLEKNI